MEIVDSSNKSILKTIQGFMQVNEFGFYLNCKGTVDNLNECHKKLLYPVYGTN